MPVYAENFILPAYSIAQHPKIESDARGGSGYIYILSGIIF